MCPHLSNSKSYHFSYIPDKTQFEQLNGTYEQNEKNRDIIKIKDVPKDFIKNSGDVPISITVENEDDKETWGSYDRMIGVIYCNDLILDEELLKAGHTINNTKVLILKATLRK